MYGINNERFGNFCHHCNETYMFEHTCPGSYNEALERRKLELIHFENEKKRKEKR